eukprot:CAMPEP_0202963022 /NCGR_PEP_ID=MMETSP1396-20130829/7027_1 /ASSEMBLY_ACC=CAM_ASM_000872 /TAXON_ID= /ORGANISM="Pseudokeronopsis sp., Strain Brazil" /LENGTH=47 /DNA_ID= /DNA_START= /DNA_END= /DNA_ORIENTATION=
MEDMREESEVKLRPTEVKEKQKLSDSFHSDFQRESNYRADSFMTENE